MHGGGHKKKAARGRTVDDDGDDGNEHYGVKIEPLNFILLR
jgi:hypothetical protein